MLLVLLQLAARVVCWATLANALDTTHTGDSSSAWRRRSRPTTSFCKDNEIWLGRYCDRTTGLVGTWIERRWVPFTPEQYNYDSEDPLPPHTPLRAGETPSKAWVEQLVSELRSAYGASSRPETPDLHSLAYKLARFGSVQEQTGAHTCPKSYACHQALDTEHIPHVLCRNLPTSLHGRTNWDVWLEPYQEQDGYMQVDVLSPAETSPPNGNGLVTVKRTFTIEHDIDDASLSVVVYSPTTMASVKPAMPWQVSSTDGAFGDPCTTWGSIGTSACQPLTLHNLRRGTTFMVEFVFNPKGLTKLLVKNFVIIVVGLHFRANPHLYGFPPRRRPHHG